MSDERKPMVIYHANCNDGFAAAWVASKVIGDDCTFVPANYGQDPPDVSGRRVFILDFSYKRPVMRSILSRAHAVTVLDHHKTAEEELSGVVDEFILRPDLISNPPGSELPRIWFDMEKSGARLAWDFFNPGQASPWIVDYVEDRDLWRWKLPHSREINSALASYPRSFKEWDAINSKTSAMDSMIAEGRAIERFRQNQIENICRNASEIEMDGHKILAVNTSVEFSEVAGRLAEGRPFGAAWFIRPDGLRQWSLRSRDGGIDVSEIARRRGGGGHRNAAGFQGELAKADGPAGGGA